MERLKQLEQNIIQWADDRGFFGKGGATLFGQYLKLREEFGELSGNFAKGRCMKDDIGDVAVVVIIMNRLSRNESVFNDPYNKTLATQRTLTTYMWKNPKEKIYLTMDNAMNYFIDFNTRRVDFLMTSSLLAFLTLFAEANSYDFTECLEHAYNEIKDRKGKWINNVFVKESDL